MLVHRANGIHIILYLRVVGARVPSLNIGKIRTLTSGSDTEANKFMILFELEARVVRFSISLHFSSVMILSAFSILRSLNTRGGSDSRQGMSNHIIFFPMFCFPNHIHMYIKYMYLGKY